MSAIADRSEWMYLQVSSDFAPGSLRPVVDTLHTTDRMADLLVGVF